MPLHQLRRLILRLLINHRDRDNVKVNSNAEQHQNNPTCHSPRNTIDDKSNLQPKNLEGRRKPTHDAGVERINLNRIHTTNGEILQSIKDIGDLNGVSEGELKRKKVQMSIAFEANKLQPGDKDYEYDVRVDFGEALSESSWD